jgi:DNA-binding transcriptional MerR regulator
MTQLIKAPLSIGDASRKTGVSQKQIRNWEARGYIPEATRVVCGERAYRYFTLKQVENIQRIKDFMDQGYTLKHASKLAQNETRKDGYEND